MTSISHDLLAATDNSNPHQSPEKRGSQRPSTFPARGFADLESAREWAMAFVQWYNHEHRHSGIRYVTPAQRHAGEDHPILAA